MSEQRSGESYLDFRARLIHERRVARAAYVREARRWQSRLDRPSPRPGNSQGGHGGDNLIFLLGDDTSPRE